MKGNKYMEKPIIAVTMGDPAGIGPEIVAKSIADKATFDVARCIVIGDKKVMEKAIEIVGADLKVNVVDSPADGDYSYGVLNMIDLDNIDMSRFEYGKINAMCGQAAFDYIKKSIEILWISRLMRLQRLLSIRNRYMLQKLTLLGIRRYLVP